MKNRVLQRNGTERQSNVRFCILNPNNICIKTSEVLKWPNWPVTSFSRKRIADIAFISFSVLLN